MSIERFFLPLRPETMKIFIPIFCIFILSFHNAGAVESNDDTTKVNHWQSGGELFGGKIFQHTPLIEPIIERPAVGGEFFLSRQTSGQNDWSAFFNHPDYGICYTFLDLGSPDYAGTAHCLFPYLNFHLFNNRNPLNLNLRIGTGLAYAGKVYDAENNPLNQAFSTHLNAILNAQLKGEYRIGGNWAMFAGAEIMHISNGAYQMPNLGLNVLGLFAGISRSFGDQIKLTPFEKSTVNTNNRNWDCSVFLSGGIKEIKPIGGKKYPAGDFNVEVTKKHLEYTRFGLSLDITYDASEYDCIIFQSLPAVDRLNTTRVGISGGYVLLLGKLSLDTYLGVYLHEENPLYGKIYQRTNLRYPLSDRVKLSLTLRNHKGKADFIGLGFGIRLTK